MPGQNTAIGDSENSTKRLARLVYAQTADGSPIKTPSQIKIPAFLMNFPFTLTVEDANNVWMEELKEEDRKIDYDKAFVQWMDLYNYIASAGLVYVLPSTGEFQDQVYVANLGIYLPHISDPTVIISNFKSVPRQGEDKVGSLFFKLMRYRVFQPETTWEGEADLKYLRDNIYVGGYGIRTDPATYKWMAKKFDMEIIPVRMSDDYLYHFDCLCIGGRSIIITDSGIKPVSELVGTNGLILTEYGPKAYKAIVSKGRKPTITIKTKNQKELIVTLDHQVRVLREGFLLWVPARELQVGDFLLSKLGNGNTIPLNLGPSLDESYLIGYLWGDGSLGSSPHRMQWMVPQHEKGNLNYLKGCMLRGKFSFSVKKRFIYLFEDGVRVSFTCSENTKFISEKEILKKWESKRSRIKESKRREAYEREFQRFREKSQKIYKETVIWVLESTDRRLRKFFPDNKKSWRSGGFLAYYSQWGQQQYAAFLKGLFTTDGSIWQSDETIGVISLVTVYKRVMEDVRLLLSLLGMNSSFTKNEVQENPYGGGVSYRVTIKGPNSWRRFANLVGFHQLEKRIKLEEAILRLKGPVYNSEIILSGVRKLLSVLIPKGTSLKGVLDINQKQRVRAVRDGQASGFTEHSLSCTLLALEALNRTGPLVDFLRDFWDQDWFEDQILEIESAQEEEVFDVVGVDTGSFLVEGLTLHNCFPLTAEKVLLCTDLLEAKDVRRVEKYAEVIDVPSDHAYNGVTNCVRIENVVMCASVFNILETDDERYQEEKDKIDWLTDVCAEEGMEAVFFNLKEKEKSGAMLSCCIMHLNYVDYANPLL